MKIKSDTEWKTEPKWLDNGHYQPCDASKFKYGYYYRCYWYDLHKPKGKRASSICECVPGFQLECCFVPKGALSYGGYMPCAFHKIEDLQGNVLLYPKPVESECDKCGRVVYLATMVVKKLKRKESCHFLCRSCNEKYKNLYEEKIIRDCSKE